MIRENISAELPHLRRYALSLARDPEVAEDLVQDCAVRAIAKEEQFVPGTHLRRWLFTILRNANIDRQRRGARRGVHVPLSDWHAATHQPARQEGRLALEDVRRQIGRLRPCDREVLRLSVFVGLSHEEIAGRLGIAIGTVKSRLSRSRAALAGH